MNRRVVNTVLALLLFAGVAAAGQRKEKEKEPPQPKLPIAEEQVINSNISEMLAAWQVGDTDLLHTHYADDVTVVSGWYEPPLMGWSSYLQAYRKQRERVQSPRLDSRNTYVNAKGNLAWAAYQWEFTAIVDGKAVAARGHTTLILEKRGNRWLIVHNHTSVIPEAQQPAAQPAQPEKPGI